MAIEQLLSRNRGDKTRIYNREEIYVDLTVVKSSVVNEEQLTNSDRDTLINNNLNEYESIRMEEIIQQGDESVYIRGVGGTGKTTMLEMYALAWAKKRLAETFDFVFLFNCREINALSEVKTVEELFKYKYPEVFDRIKLFDLQPISDRVLIIIDGLDELQDVYMFNMTSSRQLYIVASLIDTKNGVLKNHKVIACGRPKACEFIKQQFVNKSKTIEVCGFNKENISKFIDIFFDQNNEKAEEVKNALSISSNLKIMATVPVFLSVICSVYSEDLISKPLNTYTELYTYATLIFLRNHFRRTSQQTLSLFEVMENEEIMNSVYALMKLSVQTYMENKVLFTEDDIKNINCPINLELTGFIVKYDCGGIKRPVYQFRHLVLQEFFCGLYLVVTKGHSMHLKNRELSSCAPIIFGILRLLEENENDLFVNFFNTVLQISTFRIGRFKKFAVMPLRRFSFERFIKKNRIEIPECMIKENVLVINPRISECQEFLTLLYESGRKLECPFTSAKVIGSFLATDSRNAIHMLKTFNLKMKVPDVMIDKENKIFVINGSIGECQKFMMLHFERGIELEYPFTSAELVGIFSATNFINAIHMLKTFNLKLKFPAVMVDKAKKLFVINGENQECQEFMMLPFESGVELEYSFTSAELVGNFSSTESRNVIHMFKAFNLIMKFPDVMLDEKKKLIVINEELSECHELMVLVYESGIKLECPFTSAELTGKFSATAARSVIHLLKTFNLKVKFPDVMIDDNNKLFVINWSKIECQQFMMLPFKSGLKPEHPFTSAKIVGQFSSTDSGNLTRLLKTFNLKLKFPDVMIDENNNSFLIDASIPECQEFTMLPFESGLKPERPFTLAKVVGKFRATDSRNAIRMLKSFNLKIKFPDFMIDEENELFFINGSIPECQEFMMLPFESGLKLQFPFTTVQVVGKLSLTDYRNASHLLRTFNLKLKFPDVMID